MDNVFGIHAVNAFLKQYTEQAIRCYLAPDRHDKQIKRIQHFCQEAGIPIETLAKNKLVDKVGTVNHQGVVLEIKPQRELDERDLPELLEKNKNPLILILDSLQDPQNLGACLRSAGAAKVDIVIVPKDKAVGVTATVRKVACGAAEIVPLCIITNLARTIQQLQTHGVWVYGLAGEATTSFYSIDYTGPVALVLGGEQKGLRHLTRKHCDELVTIPMPGCMESLNVSVAAGVALFEVVRQRQCQ